MYTRIALNRTKKVYSDFQTIIKVDYKPPLFTYYLTTPWIQMQFSPTYGSDVIERISDDVNQPERNIYYSHQHSQIIKPFTILEKSSSYSCLFVSKYLSKIYFAIIFFLANIQQGGSHVLDSNILGHLLDKGNHSLRFGVVQCFPLRESVNRGHIFSMSQTETATPVAPILVCAVKCFFGEMHALVEKLLSNP